MSQKTEKPARQITPQKWSLLGTAAVTSLAASLATSPALATTKAPLVLAAASTEGGEAGESGKVRDNSEDREVAFLADLAYLAGTYHILATLYAEGHQDLARSHLAGSGHADYHDVESDIKHFKAPDFEPEAEAFLDAIRAGADQATVAKAAKAVFDAIDQVHAKGDLSANDEVKALAKGVASAAKDYEAGVKNGAVDEAGEYRDAWGYLVAADRQGARMAAATDAKTAEAGRSIREAIAPALAMFPSLTSQKAESDTSILHSAAAWLDFAVLRMK